MPKPKKASSRPASHEGASGAPSPAPWGRRLLTAIARHRVLAAVYLVMAVSAGYEITHKEIKEISKRQLYLDPDRNLADISAELYPNRSYSHLSRAYQAIMCEQLGFTTSPVCDQFEPGDYEAIRLELEKALAAGDKSRELMYWTYIQALLRQDEDPDKVAEAVRTWRVNFPFSKKQDPRIAHGAVEPLLPPKTTHTASYVGVESCRECHAERVDEFLATAHFKASREARPDNTDGHFGGADSVYHTRNPDLWFKMNADGEQLTLTSVTRTDNGQHERSEKVGLVFGAGADEVYHYWQGKHLFQLPIAWLRSTQQWCSAPGFIDGLANFDRPVAVRCLECHSTWFDHVPGSANAYDRNNYLVGVTCERCHGPAGPHVKHHQSSPASTDARHIVNPARLGRERQIEVCSQCHCETNRRRTAPFTYRPGQPLDAHFATDAPKDPELEHTANQTRYMRQSACFQHSETMTCVTCHDPHHAESTERSAETSCASCHQPDNCGQHDELPAALRSRCIDCHMPTGRATNVTINTARETYLPIVERHRHRIAVYPEATKATMMQWLGEQSDLASRQESQRLAQELVEFRIAKAESLRQDHRYVAAMTAYRDALTLAPNNPSILQALSQVTAERLRFDFLQQQARAQVQQLKMTGWQDKALVESASNRLRQVLQLKPNHVSTLSTLAVVMAKSGDVAAAIEQLEKSIEVDREYGYGHMLLGQLHHQEERVEEALVHYRRAETLEPYDAELQVNLGTLLAHTKQLARAETHLRQALTIAPSHAWGHHILALVLIEDERFEEALPLAKQAAALTKFEDAELLETLAKAHEGVGDRAQAKKVREHAAAIPMRAILAE